MWTKIKHKLYLKTVVFNLFILLKTETLLVKNLFKIHLKMTKQAENIKKIITYYNL